MSYWDSSALVKLFTVEADSTQFEQLASHATRVVTAALAQYEAGTTFWRKQTEGAIATGEAEMFIQQLEDDILNGNIEVIAQDDTIRHEFPEVLKKCYGNTPPILIRTNDAMHLAAAKASAETEFVTADTRQRTAAILLGFTVLP